MCDFSLEAVRSRPAKVGDKLTTRKFNWATTGFHAPEDKGMAVCLLPGTEVSFSEQVRRSATWWSKATIGYKTAIFRQIDKHKPNTHHDALEFPGGEVILLTNLADGQQVTVLQLPATTERAKAKEEMTAEADVVDAII
jgi:hypothetical protein